MLTIALLTTTIVPSLMLNARAADEGISEQAQEEVIETDDPADESTELLVDDSAEEKEDEKEDSKEEINEKVEEDDKKIEDGDNKKEDTQDAQPDPTNPKDHSKHTIRYGHFTPRGRAAVNGLVGQKDKGAEFARELAAKQLGVDEELSYVYATDVSLDEGVPFPEEGITVIVPAPGIGDGEMVILLHYVESAGYWEVLSGIASGGTVSVHLMSFSPIVVYVPLPTEGKEEEIEKLPETIKLAFYDGVTEEEMGTVEIEKDVEFRDFPTPREHESHTFIGWSHNDKILEEDEYVVVHKDTILIAMYRGASFNITYDLGGGTNHKQNPSTYSQEDLPLLFYPPNRANYAFRGWVVEGEGIPVGSVAIPLGTTGPVKVTAMWESISGSGSGGSTVVINDPSGYSFMVIRTLNNANGITYVVGYNPFGQYIGYNTLPTPTGTGTSSVLFKFYGASITFYYSFKGNTLLMGTDGNLSIDINEFTVEFRPGNWGAFERVTHNVKKGDPTPAPPTNHDLPRQLGIDSGYVFVGWMEQGDTSGRLIHTEDLPAAVEKSAVYVAQWALRSDLSYVVNYLEEGTGKVLASQKQVRNMIFGRMTSEEVAKEIEGYQLVNPELNAQTIKIGAGENVINFFYKAKTYTVTFFDDSGSILHKEENVRHGTDVAPIDDPSKDNHYFSHWDDAENLINVTSDVEVVAVFKAKTVINVLIVGNKDEVTYDGKEHKVEGYQVYGVNDKGIIYDEEGLKEMGIIVTPLFDSDSGKEVIKETDANEKGYLMGLEEGLFEATANEPHKFTINLKVEDGMLIINKLEVHVLAEDIYITYGALLPKESDVVLSSQNEGELPDGVTLKDLVSVSFDSDQNPEAPDLYEDYIVLTTKENKNINVTVEHGSLIILKIGEVIIVVPNSSKVFGEDDPNLKELVKVYGDTKGELVYIARRAPGEKVGEYNIKVIVREKDNPNYDLEDLAIANSDKTGENGTFTIIPRPATIQMNGGYSRRILEVDPVFTATVQMGVKGDKEGFLKTPDFLIENREVGEDVGVYAIPITLGTQTATNEEVTFKSGNYMVTLIPGTLTIRPNKQLLVLVNGTGGVKLYDGTPLKVGTDAYKVLGPSGMEVTAVTSGQSIINVHESGAKNTIEEVVVKVNGQTISNDNITVITHSGRLFITKRVAVITSATNNGPYSGLPFTDPSYAINDSVLENEINGVNVTGSVTFVEEGQVPNTISNYTLKPGFSESNYFIILRTGTLHVTPIKGYIDIPETIDVAGVIVPNGGKLMFDGYQHNIQATNGAGVKDDLRIEYQYQIIDKDDNIIKDWTDWSKEIPNLTQVGIMNVKAKTTNPNYLEATATGSLEIIPRPVTLTVHKDSKVVGTADTVGYKGYIVSIYEGDIDGKIEGKVLENIKEELTGLTVSRSNFDVEAVGLYEGVLEVKPLKADNFEFHVIFGDFEITETSSPPPPGPVTPDPVDPVTPDPVDPIVPIPTDDDPFLPVLPVTPVDPVVPVAPILPVPDTVIYPDPVVPTPAEPTPSEVADSVVPTAGLADDNVPLANRRGSGQWALLNLILTVLTAAATAVLWTLYFVNKRKEEEEEESKAMANGELNDEQELKRRGLWRVLSVVPALTAIVVFILTEDMRLKMVFTDRWTIVMVLIALVQVVVIFLAKKKLKKQEEEAVAST